MRHVRIVSDDATGHMTKFFTEDGSEIKGVYKYVLTCSIDRIASLKLYIHGAKVDVVAPATFLPAESAD